MCENATEAMEYRTTKTEKISDVHSAGQQRRDDKTTDPAKFASLHRWS